MNKVMLTHKERQARRDNVVRAIEDGKLSVNEISKLYSISIPYVCSIGRTVGYARMKVEKNNKYINMFLILKALLDNIDQSEVASMYKVSRQYVHQIKSRAIAAGFIFNQKNK